MRHSLPALALAVLTACAGPSTPPTPADTTTEPAGSTALAAALAGHDVVDLTHAFDASTIVWPTSKPFRLDQVAAGMTAGGFYYAANDLFTSEHGGTHLDAPVHFAEGRQTADAVPLSRLIGPAVVVDVTVAASRDADYLVSVADVEAWEQAHGVIPPNTIVLLRTAFSSRWPDAAGYLGTADRGEAALADLHFPGLDPAAAAWLVETRAVAAVGIDTASIDRGQSSTYEAHRVLADANVPIFENLARLDALPPTGAVVMALPMKVGGGSGAPLRAVALVPRVPR